MFRDIRIEILNLSGERVPFTDGKTPLKVVLHFRRVITHSYINTTSIHRPPTFTSMTPLGQYYIRQAGGGGGGRGIGPVYSVSIRTARKRYRQFLRGLWRTVRPVLWSGAKSLEREALRTGGNIITEIAANPGQTGEILSKHETETTQNI